MVACCSSSKLSTAQLGATQRLSGLRPRQRHHHLRRRRRRRRHVAAACAWCLVLGAGTGLLFGFALARFHGEYTSNQQQQLNQYTHTYTHKYIRAFPHKRPFGWRHRCAVRLLSGGGPHEHTHTHTSIHTHTRKAQSRTSAEGRADTNVVYTSGCVCFLLLVALFKQINLGMEVAVVASCQLLAFRIEFRIHIIIIIISRSAQVKFR